MTRYWYDTEFLEDGRTIELISIGIVASDGREYHAVVADGDWNRVLLSPWLVAHVVPHLPLARADVLASYLAGHPGTTLRDVCDLVTLDRLDPVVKPRALIAVEVRDFLLGTRRDASASPVELWADYAAYDHVALCQLWGRMIDLPAGVPMFTSDVQQEAARLNLRELLPAQHIGEHNALEDARMCRERWQWLQRQVAAVALAADLRVQWAETEWVETDESLVRRCTDVPCPPWETVEVELGPIVSERPADTVETASRLCPPEADEEQETDWPAFCPYDCDRCHDLDSCPCPDCTRTRDEIARDEENLS